MIHSYKGGTGKTAFSVNLARFLSLKKGKKVLLIEQDTGGSNFTSIFRKDPDFYWNDFYNSNKLIRELILPYKDFDIVCSYEQENLVPEGQSSKLFMVRHVERIRREIHFLKSTYDYIILDTRPGYTLELVTSLAIADITVLMSRVDVDTITKSIDMFSEIYANFPKNNIILIQNQIPQKIDGFEDLEIDINVLKTTQLWNSFVEGKTLLNIPFMNEIAYPLSLSQLLPIENALSPYIESFFELINSMKC